MTDIEYDAILEWLHDANEANGIYMMMEDWDTHHRLYESLRQIVKEHRLRDRQTSLPNNAALAVPLFKHKPPSDAVSKERVPNHVPNVKDVIS